MPLTPQDVDALPKEIEEALRHLPPIDCWRFEDQEQGAVSVEPNVLWLPAPDGHEVAALRVLASVPRLLRALSAASATEAALRAEVERLTRELEDERYGYRSRAETNRKWIADLTARAEAAESREAALRDTLAKVNEIRNSIIGLQTVNWSEHVYPLVAALDAAGLTGLPWPEGRARFGTMLERTNAAEAREAALRGERDEACEALAEILSLTDQHEAPGPRIPAALWLRSRSVLARIRKETPDHE